MEKRIIKFRVWDKDEKKWRQPQYTEINGLGELYFNDFPVNRTFEKQNLVLTQFTGLLDKNGKEIYEGDILYWHFGTNDGKELKFYAKCFWNEKEACFDFTKYRDEDWYGWEVIGNIYESPELLK